MTDRPTPRQGGRGWTEGKPRRALGYTLEFFPDRTARRTDASGVSKWSWEVDGRRLHVEQHFTLKDWIRDPWFKPDREDVAITRVTPRELELGRELHCRNR